jgi:hypothetical protein
MGWIAGYVLLLPLLGGAAWIVIHVIREKKARLRKLENIQRRISEREMRAPPEDVSSPDSVN